jgi:ATP-dependent helicase/DNAse subunit B
MDRKLLLGPAGAGKTQRVVDALGRLVASGPVERFVVVVPTYSRAEHLKRRLLRTGLTGMFDRGIGTFEQFAERQTSRRLSGLAPAPVRDALLVDALADAAVPDFAVAARFPGFRRAALRFFKEVKGADPRPGDPGVDAAADRLIAAGEGLPGARGRKLAGLGRVLAIYQRRLEAAGLLDHEDLLRALLARLRERPPERLKLLALDGFTDLTEVQERIVQILVEHADTALVALLADGERTDGPFAASAELRRRLRSGSRLVEERLDKNLRAGGDLARLERRLAGDDVAAAPPDGSVRFVAGADPDDEADRVARTCLRFVVDDGVPRGDVLVVVRHAESDTATRVLDAFARHGVPARRVGSTPLGASPSARSALRVARLLARRDEDGDALAAVRAGDARGVVLAEADALDRAAAETGASGVDALRRLADERKLASCEAWFDRLSALGLGDAPRSASATAAALLDAVEPLLAFSFDSADVDDVRAAADAAAVRAFTTLVAETARGLRAAGRGEAAPQEFVDRLTEAAHDAHFSPGDRRADVINVVGAEEARQWEARAVVVAGLRAGEWPGGACEDVFVSDGDRVAVARSTHVRLASRMDEALRRERLLFYMATTRARERLVLTTSTTDGKGDPALRSPFLDEALRLLPEPRLEGEERSPGDVAPAPGETFGSADLERTALAALTERFEPGTASERRAKAGLVLFAKLLGREGKGGVLSESARWFGGATASLAKRGAAREALARPRRRSASSLSSFAQCAYQHFAAKGLGLAELAAAHDDGADALLLGTIAHAVLERALLDPAGAAGVFDEVWREHAGHFAPSLRLARDKASLRRLVLRRIQDEAASPLVDGFRPTEFELAFGIGDAPPFVLAAPAGPRGEPVELAGMIDRVDVDDAGRAVVVDYKTSRVGRYAKLDEKIATGADLQLPIYAMAASSLLRRQVVAAGYVTLRDGRERWLRLAAGAPGGRGDVDWTGDERSARFAAVEARVRELDASIRDGRIEAAPRDMDRCGRGKCPFADLCRYEGTGS